MNAEIITIGDELLIGQIIDTNSAWLGQELNKIGIRIIHKCTVSDQATAIRDALDSALTRAQVIIITGGLGPTKDDVTKITLASYFNCGMRNDERVMQWVKEIFRARKLPIIESNLSQAMVPEVCEVLFNRNGTAPGMWFEKNDSVIISMPGVPFEMKSIFVEEAVPKLREKFTLPFIVHRTIQTTSIGESFLAKKIAAWEDSLPEYIRFAYLPSVGQVRLRLSGYGVNQETLIKEIQEKIDQLYDLAGEYIFGEEEDTLQQVVGKILKENKLTLSTAESCTGGYLSHMITSVPGSSSYYNGTIVSYSNDVKLNQLNVPKEIIIEQGAVSEQCVIAMADNVKQILKTDYAIATSGIAGPDGGTPEKPVGTVWIAVSGPNGTIAKMFNMGDNRERTIHRTALQGMDMLRHMILNK